MRRIDPGLLFQIVTPSVLFPWVLLVFAPGWKYTQRIAGTIAPLILCVGYIFVFLHEFGVSSATRLSLSSLALLFSNPWIALAGWSHYLAFDLFVGAWQVRDAQKIGIPHTRVIPFLLLTLIFGPMGLAGYFLLRILLKHQLDPQ